MSFVLFFMFIFSYSLPHWEDNVLKNKIDSVSVLICFNWSATIDCVHQWYQSGPESSNRPMTGFMIPPDLTQSGLVNIQSSDQHIDRVIRVARIGLGWSGHFAIQWFTNHFSMSQFLTNCKCKWQSRKSVQMFVLHKKVKMCRNIHIVNHLLNLNKQ